MKMLQKRIFGRREILPGFTDAKRKYCAMLKKKKNIKILTAQELPQLQLLGQRMKSHT